MDNVKILVGYHTPGVLLSDTILTPINAGRALHKDDFSKEAKWLCDNTIGDDYGDNISLKNETYNELTAIYWAWKNQDKLGNPSSIGFQHYRRHLIFNESLKPSGNNWTVNFEGYIGGKEKYLKNIGYSEEKVRELARDYPCIVGHYVYKRSVYQQYKDASIDQGHHIEDLDFVVKYVKQEYPEYQKAVDSYLNGNDQIFGNIFVFRKDIFDKYCQFMFDVLGVFENQLEKTLRSPWEKRFFVSERLTGIFVTKLKEEGVPTKEFNVSFVEETEEYNQPVEKKGDINIAFATDENYLPYLAVTVTSIIEHSSKAESYSLFIMHTGSPTALQKEFLENIPSRENFCIRFLNVKPLFAEVKKDDLYIEIHVSLATYYRFLIQKVFKNFGRILYLDSDIVVLDDVAKLYKLDLLNKPLGAALDIRENFAVKKDLFVSSKHINWKKYLEADLKIEPYGRYFQAGVMIFDLASMRNINFLDRCLRKLKHLKNPILSDQDVLNSEFKNEIHYFDTRWNIEWQILFEFKNYEKEMPEDLLLKYKRALKAPAIIHYASSVKPWREMDLPLAKWWWSSARSTLYYEKFLKTCLAKDENYIHSWVDSEFQKRKAWYSRCWKKIRRTVFGR